MNSVNIKIFLVKGLSFLSIALMILILKSKSDQAANLYLYSTSISLFLGFLIRFGNGAKVAKLIMKGESGGGIFSTFCIINIFYNIFSLILAANDFFYFSMAMFLSSTSSVYLLWGSYFRGRGQLFLSLVMSIVLLPISNLFIFLFFYSFIEDAWLSVIYSSAFISFIMAFIFLYFCISSGFFLLNIKYFYEYFGISKSLFVTGGGWFFLSFISWFANNELVAQDYFYYEVFVRIFSFGLPFFLYRAFFVNDENWAVLYLILLMVFSIGVSFSIYFSLPFFMALFGFLCRVVWVFIRESYVSNDSIRCRYLILYYLATFLPFLYCFGGAYV